VTVRAAHKDAARHRITFDCSVVNQHGETVISGSAEVIAPTEKIRRKRVPTPSVEVHDDHREAS
jgi:hypothetical protein